MSLLSRLSSTVRSLARAPSVRRGVRGLGRAALRAAEQPRGAGARAGSGQAPAPRGVASRGAAGSAALAARRPE